ncbi:HIT-like domain-containing protein [Piptocephalis cylindrospora]|uniref:HIT-like domain-containing protein n=1 Tax=Piptocephalis cylindrospora TaxID=1907219 RepID=A0A4V1IXX4_9FUNG|nr:HIT-like domain-containing protein [Piptocephalis cylindrospora]|eukprot:RKP12569.1 HIT-like domain-containing protein [Piptocephalis cylindrospora]
MTSIPSIPDHFTLTRVLKVDLAAKGLTLLGSLPGQGAGERDTAILIVYRLPIPSDPTGLTGFLHDLTQTELNEKNDIYSWFQAKSGEGYHDLKLNLVCPATETHVLKHSAQPMEMKEETAKLYSQIVEPYIRQLDPSRTQWVRNILQGKAEVDRVLYSDPDPQEGFVILPDFKWDQVDLTGLYLQVITRDASLTSIRDLRAGHLQLLARIEKMVYRVIQDRYGLRPSQCRLFFHYHPSYCKNSSSSKTEM